MAKKGWRIKEVMTDEPGFHSDYLVISPSGKVVENFDADEGAAREFLQKKKAQYKKAAWTRRQRARKPRKNPASSWTSLLLRTFLGATGGFITASIVTGAGAAAIGLPGAEAAAETAKRSWTGAIVGGIAGLLVKKPLTAAAVGALAGGTGVAIFGVASGARSGVAGYHSLAAYVPAGQDTTSALAGYVVG